MALTREQILAADDGVRETIAVPEWGGDILVRALTAGDRDELENMVLTAREAGKGAEGLRAFVLSRCIVDNNGARLFTAADMDALNAKNAQVVDRVYAVVTRLSLIGRQVAEDLAKK